MNHSGVHLRSASVSHLETGVRSLPPVDMRDNMSQIVSSRPIRHAFRIQKSVLNTRTNCSNSLPDPCVLLQISRRVCEIMCVHVECSFRLERSSNSIRKRQLATNYYTFLASGVTTSALLYTAQEVAPEVHPSTTQLDPRHQSARSNGETSSVCKKSL